jgi:SAM-dependent methyltransferase
MAEFASTAKSYSEVGDLESMRHAINYNRSLLNLIVAHGTSPALDFGAGLGTHAEKCRDLGWEVTCIEPDTRFRQLLEERQFATAPSLQSLPSNAFPFVYSFNVLEHIEDDLSALKDLFRVLRPGGRLLLYLPAFQILYGPMDAAVGHYRRYTRGNLVPKLKEAGFIIERTGYADSLGLPAAFLYKHVGGGPVSPRSVWLYDSFVFPINKIVDYVISPILGKNIFATARKPQT